MKSKFMIMYFIKSTTTLEYHSHLKMVQFNVLCCFYLCSLTFLCPHPSEFAFI